MQFRHPEQLDRQRFHHDLSDGGPLALNRPAENLLALLVIVALLSLFAVAALAAEGISLTPLIAILGSAAVLLLLPGLRRG